MGTKRSVGHSGAYWRVWCALLIITLLMVSFDRSPVSRALLVVVLVSAMLLKASLIAAWFMHLRFERRALAVIVAVGLLFTGAILFGLLVPDAVRIHELSQ
jgi:caa(3)-type oxidase subunit IV